MSGEGITSRRRLKGLAWPVLVAILAAGWTTDGAAQSLAVPAASLPAPPSGDPGSQPAGGPSPALPASTVSPSIERFVRESGRDVPQARPSPPVRPRVVPVNRPTATTPPPPSLGTEPPAEQGGNQSLPPALPAVPAADRSPVSGDSRVAAGLSPLLTDLRVKAAPLDANDRRFPITLATALRLSDARPLIVAAAQASVWVSEAELTRAKVLWVPNATLGADYIRHDGGGPDFNKGIMTAPSVNYFYAGPSLFQSVNLTDVIFQPLAARQDLNSRHWDVQSAKNDALLQTADAYFQVHQARGNFAGALYTVERGKQLVRKIETMSEDLVTKVEVERAKNLLADLEQRAVLARQEWRVRSANLTQVLRLDPRAVVDPLEHDHAQVTLIDPGRTLDDLMAVALTNRPELASREAMVVAAEYRVRREKSRPFLPMFLLNGFQTSGGMMIQGGIFGISPNSSLKQFFGRDDVSLQAVWQLEGLGIGNLARIKSQRGLQSRAVIDFRRTQDQVAGEVNRAQARVQSGAARVLQADRSLRTGIISFNGQIEGLGQTRRFGDVLYLVFRPQETIFTLDLLSTAFNEYFTTVADYNRAQFELFHALGYPARELTERRPPGEVLPTDLARPRYLPAVGNGPPPATR